MVSDFFANFQTTNVAKLQSLWRPFLIFMRVSGLAFSNDPHWNPLKLYSLAMVCFSWIILGFHFYWLLFGFRYGVTFDLNGRNMRHLTMVLYMVRISIKCSTLFLAFHRDDCMQRVFQLWSTLKLPCKISHRLETIVCWSTKVAVLVTLIGFIITEILEIFGWMNSRHNVSIMAPYIALGLLDFVSGVFCWLMVTTMTALFFAINECFPRRSLKNGIKLHELCSTFYTAVDIVSVSDVSLNIMFGGQLLSNLLQMCVDTYILVFDHTKPVVNVLLHCYWASLAACRFWFIFWGAAKLNSEAHRLLNYIHLLPLNTISPSEMVQALLLQNRLSTCNIGFSMFGLQTITKGLLPVLLSGYTTYVFLLAQFHLAKTTPGCDCHCFHNYTDQ